MVSQHNCSDMASATCAECLRWNYSEEEIQLWNDYKKEHIGFSFTFSPAKDDDLPQKAIWHSSPCNSGSLTRKGDTRDANQDHWIFYSLPMTWTSSISDVPRVENGTSELYTSFTLGNTYALPSSVLYTPTRRSVLLGSVSTRNCVTRASRPSKNAFLIGIHQCVNFIIYLYGPPGHLERGLQRYYPFCFWWWAEKIGLLYLILYAVSAGKYVA